MNSLLNNPEIPLALKVPSDFSSEKVATLLALHLLRAGAAAIKTNHPAATPREKPFTPRYNNPIMSISATLLAEVDIANINIEDRLYSIEYHINFAQKHIFGHLPDETYVGFTSTPSWDFLYCVFTEPRHIFKYPHLSAEDIFEPLFALDSSYALFFLHLHTWNNFWSTTIAKSVGK